MHFEAVNYFSYTQKFTADFTYLTTEFITAGPMQFSQKCT